MDDCDKCGDDLCDECGMCWNCSGGCDCEIYGYMDEDE